MIGDKNITTRQHHRKGGKHHRGVHHKGAEHGDVCAKTKTHIHESVVMARYGLKGLETLHEAQYSQTSNGKELM